MEFDAADKTVTKITNRDLWRAGLIRSTSSGLDICVDAEKNKNIFPGR